MSENTIKPRKVTFDTYSQPDYVVWPNQKEVKVKMPKPQSPFCAIEDRFMYGSMSIIKSYAGFKLYLYLCDNANNYQFSLSSKSVEGKTHMSNKSYDRAVKQLIEDGYLIKDERKDNFYYFVPIPYIGDKDKFFEWCDKTNAKGFVYEEEDYDYEYDYDDEYEDEFDEE